MNNSERQLNKKNPAIFLIFLGWLVYTISLLGKVNYSANITQIIDFYGVTRTQAGTVPTFLFFSYGVGQVLNGLLCRKYNIKWMIFISLLVSAVVNLIIAVGSDFSMIKWLWLINGIALSVLWPSLIRLLSESLPKKVLGLSSVIMGTTIAAGTLIIYGLSSIYAAFDKFKLSFYTAGIAVIAVAVFWLFFYDKAVMDAKKENEKEEKKEETKTEIYSAVEQGKNEKRLLFASIYVLCFCAVGINLIKDGLTTWVPSILKEEFHMSDSISILLTLFLPVVAVFGNPFSLKIHSIIPDYANHCAIIFAIIGVLIGGIIGSLTFKIVAFMFFGLVAVYFLASSLNSVITSIFPLFMRGNVNSGLLAGVLNGFCYLGSTVSAYGLGIIADNFGWEVVFLTLIGFCVAVFVVWIGYVYFKKILSSKNV